MNLVLENIPPLRMIRFSRIIRSNRMIRFKLSLQLLAVLGLVFALTACGGGDDDDKTKGAATLVTSATPVGETYDSAQSVTLACTDTGSGCAATYYYITDGIETPPSTSIAYTGAINIDTEGITELWFFSIDNVGKREAWRTQTYLIDTIPPVTAATPAGNTYNEEQQVTLDCLDYGGSGCVMTYYTTDGSTPDVDLEATQIYTGAITMALNTTTELKFFSVDNAGNREDNTGAPETYLIDPDAPITNADPVGGVYHFPQTITLECVDNTGCVETFYTTDGSDPITSSTQIIYATPISIDTSTALRFYSVDDASNSDLVQTQIYSIPSPLASGMFNSAFLKIDPSTKDGEVWTWGLNYMDIRLGDYQLGDGITGPGRTYNRAMPGQVCASDVIVPPCSTANANVLTNVTAIAGSGHHTLALKGDNTVFAWGDNNVGQVGDSVKGPDHATPVPVVGADFEANTITTIAVGRWHSLAIDDNATVWTWGGNSQGQLGQGDTTKGGKVPPAQVCESGLELPLVDACSSANSNVLTNVVAVAAGHWYSVALKADGSVWTWGGRLDGSGGDTGAPTAFPPNLTPQQVDGLADVIAISGGRNHVLALKRDGTVLAWGYNAYGQLGNGTQFNSEAFVQVCNSGATYPCTDDNNFLTNVIAIGAGREHSLALKRDGTVWAWGLNEHGQLGDGTTITNDRATITTMPAQVVGENGVDFLTKVVAIGGGMGHSAHSLALDSEGILWTWGRDGDGELGNDAFLTSSPTPVQVDMTDMTP